MDETQVIELMKNTAIESDFGAPRVDIVWGSCGLAAIWARKFHAIANEMDYNAKLLGNFIVKINRTLFYFWSEGVWENMPHKLGVPIIVSEELGRNTPTSASPN